MSGSVKRKRPSGRSLAAANGDKVPSTLSSRHVSDSDSVSDHDSSSDHDAQTEKRQKQLQSQLLGNPEVDDSSASSPTEDGSSAASSSAADNSSGEDDIEGDLHDMELGRSTQHTAPTNLVKSGQSSFGSKAYRNEYKPPHGFLPPSDAKTVKLKLDSTKALGSESLAGKQIWHICAPAHLKLANLDEVPLQHLLDEGPVLKQKDVSYHFLTCNLEPNERTLFLPNNGAYSMVNVAISKSLQLAQDTGSNQNGTEKPGSAVTETSTPADKVPQRTEQPEGLRMRFQPIGIPFKRKPLPPLRLEKKLSAEKKKKKKRKDKAKRKVVKKFKSKKGF